MTVPFNDLIFQEVALYIEGVQVPWISISISTAYSSLPQASISIPPQAGLTEISRFYEPKVHIFYYDHVYEKLCLLFSGVIAGSSYNRSALDASISFQCNHKYAVLGDLTMDYTGYVGTTASKTDPDVLAQGRSGTQVKLKAWGTQNSIFRALEGVDCTGSQDSKSQVTKENVKEGTHSLTSLPNSLQPYRHRLSGLAGVPLNIWNQIKEAAYSMEAPSDAAEKMFIPMVEDSRSLSLFMRISGHPYLENKLVDSKSAACHVKAGAGTANPILVPPSVKTFIKTAYQADLAYRVVQSQAQFSGEVSSFMDILSQFYSSIEYDFVFLNSPAKVDGLQAVDVIVKPQLPFYYTPLCNFIPHKLVTAISFSQNDHEIPTRITVSSTDAISEASGQLDRHFRAPHSIREAIVSKNSSGDKDLRSTTGSSFNAVGKYEQARGIKHFRIDLPRWLEYFNNSRSVEGTKTTGLNPEPNSADAEMMETMSKAWEARYGKEAAALNPWGLGLDNKTPSEQRMLFAAADYAFTKAVASSRHGMCSMVFNPYIVAGYPIDFIEVSPMLPSIHAFCTSVTHSFSSSGNMSTEVQFVAATTYEELSNYQMNFVHPWTQAALGVTSKQGDKYKSSIVDNEAGKEAANEFYLQVLGVGAIAPEDVYDFSTGEYRGLGGKISKLIKGTSPTKSETSWDESAAGSLALISRPIESIEDIEEQSSIKFIDMTPGNYNPTVVRYQASNTLDEAGLKEPGENLFLEYEPVMEGVYKWQAIN